MSRAPDFECRGSFLRFRVTDNDKKAIKELMVQLKYKGQEADFCAYLLERGRELVLKEQAIIKREMP